MLSGNENANCSVAIQNLNTAITGHAFVFGFEDFHLMRAFASQV